MNARSHQSSSGVRREPISVELFAGAGGLALGLEQAGFAVACSVENDAVAVETLNLNRGRFFPSLLPAAPLDITTADPRQVMQDLSIRPGELDLIAAGPPCVAFSKSGFHLEYKRLGKDPRASLLDDFVRFLDAFRPAAYILENVHGLAFRNQAAPFFRRLLSGISELGYSVSYKVLNAADYGVPQNRQRLFIIGARDGRGLEFPAPTHWGRLERRRPPSGAERLLAHVTAGQALEGSRSEPEPEESVRGKYGGLLGEIPPGCNYLYFTEHEGHPSPLFRWRSRYWSFLLKLHPERPSPTIQAQPGPYVGPFHWENRRLRVPELMRLQTFPDEFRFAGDRREIQRQIGNAVPPLLGEALAAAIRSQLCAQDSPRVAQKAFQVPMSI